VKDLGRRYYSPTLGRWISRDPIGERGGVNLCGALGNNPPNRRDRFGLDLTERQCMNAFGQFYNHNPVWKEKVDYWAGQRGKKKCIMEPVCKCCSGKARGGCRRKVSESFRIYEVTICYNKVDATSVYPVIAHELVHFLAGCADLDDRFDCMQRQGQDYFDCNCAQYICGEVRAFRQSGACRTPDECWELIVGGGYLGGAPCNPPAPYTPPTRARIWAFMDRCVAVDGLPLPHYPQPVPDL
jgi:hypothetical protein